MPKFKQGLNSRMSKNGTFESFPPLGNDFSNSFFPHFTKSWNNLQTEIKSEKDIAIFKSSLKSKIKPKKHKHFSRGCKTGNSLLTQLRVGRSFLNVHGFQINFSSTDKCDCSRIETVSHFLNQCFLFQPEREVLFNSIQKILPKFKTFSDKKKTDTLLFGINLDSEENDSRNIPITIAVQKFILQTGRFKKPSP